MDRPIFAAALFMTLMGLATSAWAQDVPAQSMQAGNAAYAAKNYDQAIASYQAVLQTNPNYWQAYQGIGNCYYAKGQFSDALTSYQKALAINPQNPTLASFTQALQAKIGVAAPALPALPATLPNTPLPPASLPVVAEPNRALSSEGANKVQIQLLGGGDFILGATNPIPSTVITAQTGLTIPWAGGFGAGGGGGLEVFFPLNRNISFSFGSAFIGYGATYNYTISDTNYGYYYGYGYNYAVTETVSQSAIEELVSIKYCFDANGARPYLLAGVGSAEVFTGITLNATVSGYGTILGSYSYLFPPYVTFSPMVQVGLGVQFPMGTGSNLFVETKFGLVFMGATPQTGLINVQGTLYPYSFKSPGSTLIELPIDAGLNFDL